MKIQYVSDVHMEQRSHMHPLLEVELGTDLFILGGDISTETRDAVTFVRYVRQYYHGPIVYIMGNHEYYGRVFGHGQNDFVKAFDGMNVIVVHDFYRQVDSTAGIEIIAAPLWTNFDHGRDMVTAVHGISDFSAIHEVDSEDRLVNVSPHTMETAYARQRGSILCELDEANKAGYKTVVATHFAPTRKSIDAKHEGSPLNGYFCNDMEGDIMACPATYWLHGHTHTPADYMIGDTHVLSAPVGYPWEDSGQHSVVLNVGD